MADFRPGLDTYEEPLYGGEWSEDGIPAPTAEDLANMQPMSSAPIAGQPAAMNYGSATEIANAQNAALSDIYAGLNKQRDAALQATLQNNNKYMDYAATSIDNLLAAREDALKNSQAMSDDFYNRYGSVLNEDALDFLQQQSNIDAPTLTSIMAGYEGAKASRAEMEKTRLDNDLDRVNKALELEEKTQEARRALEERRLTSSNAAIQAQLGLDETKANAEIAAVNNTTTGQQADLAAQQAKELAAQTHQNTLAEIKARGENELAVVDRQQNANYYRKRRIDEAYANVVEALAKAPIEAKVAAQKHLYDMELQVQMIEADKFLAKQNNDAMLQRAAAKIDESYKETMLNNNTKLEIAQRLIDERAKNRLDKRFIAKLELAVRDARAGKRQQLDALLGAANFATKYAVAKMQFDTAAEDRKVDKQRVDIARDRLNETISQNNKTNEYKQQMADFEKQQHSDDERFRYYQELNKTLINDADNITLIAIANKKIQQAKADNESDERIKQLELARDKARKEDDAELKKILTEWEEGGKNARNRADNAMKWALNAVDTQKADAKSYKEAMERDGKRLAMIGDRLETIDQNMYDRLRDRKEDDTTLAETLLNVDTARLTELTKYLPDAVANQIKAAQADAKAVESDSKAALNLAQASRQLYEQDGDSPLTELFKGMASKPGKSITLENGTTTTFKDGNITQTRGSNSPTQVAFNTAITAIPLDDIKAVSSHVESGKERLDDAGSTTIQVDQTEKEKQLKANQEAAIKAVQNEHKLMNSVETITKSRNLYNPNAMHLTHDEKEALVKSFAAASVLNEALNGSYHSGIRAYREAEQEINTAKLNGKSTDGMTMPKRPGSISFRDSATGFFPDRHPKLPEEMADVNTMLHFSNWFTKNGMIFETPEDVIAGFRQFQAEQSKEAAE